MWSLPLFSRTSTAFSLYFLPLASAQSIPGASFLLGNGAPGAGQYNLVDDYEGSSDFFSKFNYYSSYDPTYGHVQYVNESIALQNHYATTSNQGTAVISVDTTNKWPRGGPGRPALRLISDNTYTHGLFILDLLHMPYGCGTWPAYWLLGPDWPYNGEIDIIEGVNTIKMNSVTLHTSSNCTIAGSGQSGSFQTSDCSGGCGSTLSNTATPNNYGDSLNNNGGGIYATEWTSNYIKTWFFPRNRIPASITGGAPNPAADFGTPAVNQQGSCSIDNHFNNMSLIINTDFCGAWAGQVYSSGYPSCPQSSTATNSLDSCVDFVGNNPSYFTNAYWEIKSIKVYQMPLGAKPSSSYSTSLSSVRPSAKTETVPLAMGTTASSISSSRYTEPLSAGSSSSSPTSIPPVSSKQASSQTSTALSAYQSSIAMASSPGVADTPAVGVKPSTMLGNASPVDSSPAQSSSATALPVSSSTPNSARVSVAPAGSSSSPSQSGSAPPCPTDASALCYSPNASTTCSSSSGDIYLMSCGIQYQGTVIGAAQPLMVKRIMEPTLDACQTICHNTQGCVAINYKDYTCTILSTVTGTASVPGAVAGTMVSSSHGGSSSSTAAGQSVPTTTITTGIPPGSRITTTILPSNAVTLTVPAGGFYTSGTDGSFYVYTTTPTQSGSGGGKGGVSNGCVSLCFNCALTPTVVSCGYGGSTSAGTSTRPTSTPQPPDSLVPTSNRNPGPGNGTLVGPPSIGTTTFFTTQTITSCAIPAICPAPGYILGNNATHSDAVIVTTTHTNGEALTYTQIPATKRRHGHCKPLPTAAPTYKTLPTCQESDDSVFTSPIGLQYLIMCDEKFAEETLQTSNQTDLASCISACDMANLASFMTASPCLGVTFYPDQQADNCLLKTGATAVFQRGADSALLLNPYAGPSESNTTTSLGPVSIGAMSTMPMRLVSYVPTTIVSTAITTAVSTAVSTAISVAFSTLVIHDITQIYTVQGTTAVSVLTLPPNTVTATVTTVSVSISISNQIITETVTATPPTVTTTYYSRPSSKTFSCRTYATNYLDGHHGKMRRDNKRSLFDSDSPLLLGEVVRIPMPGALPRL